MSTQPPTDDAPFTTGEFYADGREVGVEWEGYMFKLEEYQAAEADAKLLHAALTAATSLHRSGYDAQKVFKALPDLMKPLEICFNEQVAQKLSTLRRKPKPC